MLPKAELHVHLEGTIRPEIARMLAKRNHLLFPESILDSNGQHYPADNFMQFLSLYDQLAALIRQPQDYFDITYDYLKQSSLSGCIYTEMMYSPDHAERISNIPSSEHLTAIGEAINKAFDDFGIIGRIITTAVRHFGVSACENVALQAQNKPFDFVIGFGLGGDEENYPPQLFTKTYAMAREAGLKTTIHAGEWSDHLSIEQAINCCKVDRIGHGVRAIESQHTIDLINDLGIHLEICPSSNVAFGIYPNISAHPLPKFIENKVSVSINSDDPPFIPTTIDKEYAVVQKVFNFNDEKMRQLTVNAIKASFVSEEIKHQLLTKIVEQSQ